jgi:ribose 5-phosphate isomerase B
MAANKHQGIRSAVCWNEEIGRLARAHNDANICALPGRFISEAEAIVIIKAFLTTPFEGGRHKRRIDKIPLKQY